MPVKVEYLGLIPISAINIVNRARIDKGEIDVMAASLKDRGQIHPIVVNPDMELMAGERRILGALQIGWEDIRAEMRTGDNKVDGVEVELDENACRKDFTWVERAKLEKLIFDMKVKKDPKWSHRRQAEYRDTSRQLVDMRIELAEAMELIPELADYSTQDDAWKLYKKLEENVTVGQLRTVIPDIVRDAPTWATNHYVVRDTLDGMSQIADETFDFAEVDPPYAIDLVRRKAGRNEDVGHTDTYDEISVEAFPPFMGAVIPAVYRLLKPNSFAVFWYGWQWHCEMHTWLTRSRFGVNPIPAIWYKGIVGQTAQPDVALGSVHEPFLLVRKGQPKMKRQGRANVFHYSAVPPAKKTHSTEKPIELLTDLLDTILFPGSNILVPFLGSGVTLRAAYRLGHTGLGFDRSEVHKANFLDRVRADLGGRVESDNDGEQP